jgi:hypothetical protein
MIGFAAHLRVYEPIGSLPEAERRRWTAYTESGQAASRPVLMEREHGVALVAAARLVPRLRFDDGVDHAYVRHLDGLTYVCPWRWQLRVWEALEEFRSGLPEQIADAFVPGSVATMAGDEADAWRARHPDVRAPIRSVGWHVPATWFALFDADERRVVLGDRRSSAAGGSGLDRSLLYLTAMSRARRRVARALHVVQRTLEGSAAELLEELARWLEDFHPHSLLELDYGGLVHLIDDDALTSDTSVEDIAGALQCLSDGDAAGAGERYERVTLRWREIAALERAN